MKVYGFHNALASVSVLKLLLSKEKQMMSYLKEKVLTVNSNTTVQRLAAKVKIGTI